MEASFFSVVIPTYNSSCTIGRTLESVAVQTLPPYEVIIVDDASSDYDQLEEVVSSFKSIISNIVLLRNKVNVNGAASRNKGILSASAAFIAFLDSDDEWEPEKLEIYANLINEKGSNYLYFSQVSVVLDGKTQSIRPTVSPENGYSVSEYLFLSGGFIQTSTIVMSNDEASRILFDERFKRHQDYDFCLRCVASGVTPYYIPIPLSKYHISGAVFRSKNEDVDYCKWWLSQMQPYMSRYGYYGYKFFALSGRLYVAKRYSAMIVNALGALFGLGPIGIWRARRKIYHVLKSL